MQRPIEINQKKTRLIQMAAVGLGLAAFMAWLHYDKIVPLSWESVFQSFGILIAGIPGLMALVALVISLFRHEPYLLIYDDCIEMPRLLSRNCRVLHFCDVKSMRKEGETKAVFCLQPYLKRSDLPGWIRYVKRFLGNDFGISLSALDMPSKDAYELIYERFKRYHYRYQREDEE